MIYTRMGLQSLSEFSNIACTKRKSVTQPEAIGIKLGEGGLLLFVVFFLQWRLATGYCIHVNGNFFFINVVYNQQTG